MYILFPVNYFPSPDVHANPCLATHSLRKAASVDLRRASTLINGEILFGGDVFG